MYKKIVITVDADGFFRAAVSDSFGVRDSKRFEFEPELLAFIGGKLAELG